jgi:multisubunit Na+/H+ antiporter MnhE subunit
MSVPSQPAKRNWLMRAIGLVWFGFCFLRELTVANLQMAKVVLFRPTSTLSPDFIDYSIEGLSAFEIVVLSHCITLTPGTTSVEISEDRKNLVIHALDAGDPAGVCAGIKKTLEEPILAWTR